ncbi:TPA: autotransporter outer membrane beta-barrel domain-containing protein [Stenotrophomonas maltophilia]
MTHPMHPRRCALAFALAVALAAPAHAQQVVADGDEQTPAAGDYRTTDPVEPGNPAGHAFHVLNGGSIIPLGEVNLHTEGMRATAARVEGRGSVLRLSGGSITTQGYGAAGVSVGTGGKAQLEGTRINIHAGEGAGLLTDGGLIDASNVHITMHGALGKGVSAQAGRIELRDSVVEMQGTSSKGLDASGGEIVAERVRIEMAAAGEGISASNGGKVSVADSQINGTGAGSSGVGVAAGSSVSLDNVDIQLNHARSGPGMSVAGEVDMRGGSIHTAGSNSTAISFASRGGKVTLDGTRVSGHYGIFMSEDSELTLRNSVVKATSVGLDINQRGSNALLEGSHIEASAGDGIRMMDDGTLTLRGGSSVVSDGTQNNALYTRGGRVLLQSSQVTARGYNSHGLFAEGSLMLRPVVDAQDAVITTHGEGSIGVISREGATVNLADSWVTTHGASSYGVLAGGTGEMSLTNTHVRTEGEGAWAAVVNNDGKLSINGGSLMSEQHGGIWMRSSREPGLTLANGAVVSGGNGIALALDAAVAGRFDVKLDSGAVMIGDIVITPEDEDAGLVPQSEVHVQLTNNAGWHGASHLVQGMALDGGSQWVLNGNATVQDLAVRDSQVALSDGSGRFNVLTVDGDLHSEGSTFLFNGALAGDTSDIDRLHVRGDASGNASIVVNNIGGVGAPTFDGIQLIRIDGNSLADYALAGRAVGGAYEYFLFKGGLLDPNDGNWYLRSQWFDICEEDPNAPGCVVDPGPDPDPDPVDPIDPIDPVDPVDPITPPPVLRPEAGAYLANQSAAVNMFAHRLSDRMGAVAMSDERAAWARVARSNADFTAVGGQLSVDGNTSVMQIGTDVWRRGNAALGVMLGSGRADNTVVSGLTGYSAKGRVRGTAVGVYGTWLQQADGSEGAYVDAQLQYGRFSNRVHGIALDQESYDSRMRSGSLEGGYTFNVWQGASSNVYVQPQMQLTYTDYSADRHVESNGTVVDGAEAGGLAGRVGVRAFGQRAGMGTLVQPYLGVNWLRSSGRNAIDFRGETLQADLPRNRYEVQAGAELKISQRLGAWGGLSMQRGDHGYRDVGGQVGVRLAW